MIGISVIKELKEDVCSQKKRYRAKAMHDCNDKKVEADGSIDKYLSYHWKKDRYVTCQPKN